MADAENELKPANQRKQSSSFRITVKRVITAGGVFIAATVGGYLGDKFFNNSRVFHWLSDKLSGRTEEGVAKDADETSVELSSKPEIPDENRENIKKNLKNLYLGLEEYLEFRHPASYHSEKGVLKASLNKIMEAAAIDKELLKQLAAREFTAQEMIYENRGIGPILDSMGIKGPLSNYGRSNSDAWKRRGADGKPIPTIAEIFNANQPGNNIQQPKENKDELKGKQGRANKGPELGDIAGRRERRERSWAAKGQSQRSGTHFSDFADRNRNKNGGTSRG